MKTIDEASYFDKRISVISGKIGKIIRVINELNRFNIYLDYLIYDKDTVVVQGKTQGIIDTLYKRLRQYEIVYKVMLDETNEYMFGNLKSGIIRYTVEVPITKKENFKELIRSKNWVNLIKTEKVSVKL